MIFPTPLFRTSLLLAGLFAVACSADPNYGTAGAGGGSGTGAGGSGGGAGGSGGGGQPPGPANGLPVPPGPSDLPPPAGAPGGLKLLSWAGFKSALTYTFDDAQPSQLEHYADLNATGVRHTFFITSSSSTATANFDATFTQAVKDGHEMGNHSVHHCHADLTGCSNTSGAAASLNAEIDDCTSYITGHFGQPAVWTAASPFGDNGYNAPSAARFILNRGVQSGTIGPKDSTDPFNLPCHAAVDAETAASFNAAIDSAHTAGRWLIMLVHTITPTGASWYAPIPIATVTDSVAHAKTLGDVWIDSMVNIGAYWRAEKTVAQVTPTTSGGAQTWTWTLPDHFPTGQRLRFTVDGGTPSQSGTPLAWDGHGYYELALDAGPLTLSP